MKRNGLVISVVLALAFSSFSSIFADDIFRIEVANDYKKYSNNEDLKRRVWQLERAVEQLQMRVFNLEGKSYQPVAVPVQMPAQPMKPQEKEWTCHMQRFGQPFSGSGKTKAAAMAEALKHCGEKYAFCDKKDLECGNE